MAFSTVFILAALASLSGGSAAFAQWSGGATGSFGMGLGNIALGQSILSGTQRLGNQGRPSNAPSGGGIRPSNAPYRVARPSGPSVDVLFHQLGKGIAAGPANTALLNRATFAQIDAAMAYRSDPRVSASIRAEMFHGANPGDKVLRGFESFIAGHGYSSHNVADVTAVMLWSFWGITNGADPTEAQIRGVHQQVRAVWLASPILRTMPNETRQRLAEMLIYYAVDAAGTANHSDPAKLAALRRLLSGLVSSMTGLDLTQMEVTDGGFMLRRATGALAVGPGAAAQPVAAAQPDIGDDLAECRDGNADANQRATACARVAENDPAVKAVKEKYQAAIMAALSKCRNVSQEAGACGRAAANDPAVKAAMEETRAVLRQRIIALLTAGAAPRTTAPPAPAQSVAARPDEPPGDLAECMKEAGGKDVPRGLDACTRAIEANAGNSDALTKAYLTRVSLYARLRQFDRMIADCDQLLRIAPQGPLSAIAYGFRGVALTQQHEFERAAADLDKAVSPSNPLLAEAYSGRGNVYLKMANYQRARADLDKAISLKPGFSAAYAIRARYRLEQDDTAGALADVNEGLRLDPNNADFYALRAEYYVRMGRLNDAQADADRALGISPASAGAHALRGRVALAQGRTEVALGELTEAVDLDSQEPEAVAMRGMAYERSGRADRALADYRRALQLTPSSRLGREAQENARKRIAALADAPAAPPAVAVPATPLGRRIALVIGMSAYANVTPLRNPASDAHAIADAFRRLGFAEVIEREDLTRAKLEEALEDFGDKAAAADWAVIYYAGHGVERDGVNYLIPVDAKLTRAEHLDDEAVTLTRVLSKTEEAHKLRMVILDACRSNPFRMASAEGRSRAISRGLSPVEPARGELVVYAARDGTTADDGDSGHSPFTQALLSNVETPNLDIRIMFSKVRDQVLARTNNAQEPFTYGSLPGQEFYFKQAGR